MRLLSFSLCLMAVWLQNPPTRPTPQQPTNTEERGSEQSPFVIKILPQQAQNESQSIAEKGSSSPTNSWTLSDKIAVIASIVAFLQFGALVLTVFVMIRNGRRQLRGYVLPENSGILEGNMLVAADRLVDTSLTLKIGARMPIT